MRVKIISRLYLLLVCLFLSTSIQAGWIETEIIKVKSGRIYLDAGYDQNILPNGRCRIINGSDTLDFTTIESVLPGISYSKIINSYLIDSLLHKSKQLQVETYDIDSTSVIKIIAYRIWTPESITSSDYNLTENNNGPNGNLIEVLETDNLLSHDRRDEFQGVIEIARASDDSSQIYPAPFIATMLPRFHSNINDEGMLTTALYYYYDDNLHLLYNFDGVTTTARSFNSQTVSPKRPYPFKYRNGQKLLNEQVDTDSGVKLGSSSYYLYDFRYLFADFLVGEKVTVDLSDTSDPSDIQFCWTSFDSSDPIVAFEEISDGLNGYESKKGAVKEAIDLISIRIKSARTNNDSTTVKYYLDLIEKSLYEELGVFPLFRPYLIFRPQELLRGVHVMPNGKLDLTNAILLKRPNEESSP